MPFGYSQKVFPRPAVEYIPLLPVELLKSSKDLALHKPQILLIDSNEDFEIYPLLDQFPNFRLKPTQELGLILINASLETIKYRGNHVTVLAQPAQNSHQVVKIVTRYFYKSDLVFQLVDLDGNLHSQKSLSLPTKR